MVAKVQILRTETPNAAPTGLLPGELVIEMAIPTRLWVGVPPTLDPTMRKLLFDSSNIYMTQAEGDTRYVNIPGDTMTGFLYLHANPIDPFHAATKQYVDTAVGAIPIVTDLWVDITGDTMTGPLTINSNLAVAGTSSFTGRSWFGAGWDNVAGNIWNAGDFNNSGSLTVGSTAIFNALTFCNAPLTINHAVSGGAHCWLRGFSGTAGGGPTGNPYQAFNFEITSPGLVIFSHDPGPHIEFSFDVAAAASFQLRNNGLAYKAGGGTWSDPSDARIKNVLGDYTRGLTAINALKPVRFTYKGNDSMSVPSHYAMGRGPEEGEIEPTTTPTAPFKNSYHYGVAAAAKEFVGFVAQDVETIMPEMVTQESGWVDGVKVTDLRTVDATPLIYALVNAVKELTARVAALEAAP